jgi:hypothetical protein
MAQSIRCLIEEVYRRFLMTNNVRKSDNWIAKTCDESSAHLVNYIQTIKRLLAPNKFNYLLETVEYDETVSFQTPHPYSNFPERVNQLYGDFCSIKELERNVFELRGHQVTRVIYHLMEKTEEERSLDFWKTRWINGNIAFHMKERNPWV